MTLTHLPIGPWTVTFGDHERIASDVVEQLELFLTNDWRSALLHTVEQHWWSSKVRNIPSPVVRIDMAPTRISDKENLKRHIYEVETRPAGLGMTAIAPWNGQQELVHTRLRSALRECTGFVRTEDSHIHDDSICADFLGVPMHYVRANEPLPEMPGPLWIRSATATALEHQALGPIIEDGDKRYMVILGMATTPNASTINWDEPFVIKPLRGTWARDIHVYAPKQIAKRLRITNTATQTKICRELDDESKSYILQPLILPQSSTINNEQGFKIWRLMFGWIDEQYQFIGGFWNWLPASKGLRIHGRPEAIFGTVHI